MENEKNPAYSQDNLGFDELLDVPAFTKEIGPDEHAVSAAGLTHPDDLELEMIISETKSEDRISAAADPIQPVPRSPTTRRTQPGFCLIPVYCLTKCPPLRRTHPHRRKKNP